jgi:hypothetical protein
MEPNGNQEGLPFSYRKKVLNLTPDSPAPSYYSKAAVALSARAKLSELKNLTAVAQRAVSGI